MVSWIAFVLVAGLMVVGYLLVQPESEPAEPTMAEVWARTADASLDIRMERFFSQMPDDLASAQWTVEANDIGQFLDKLRIARQLELTEPMRL